MKHLLKRRELDNSSKPNQIKSKRQPARERIPHKKKELLTLALGDACKWKMLKTMKMMIGENQSKQSQVHVTAF